MKLISNVKMKGEIDIHIRYIDGQEKVIHIKNKVLKSGKEALAACLANVVGNDFQFYVNRMLFGSGGTIDGVPRKVDVSRNKLFGVTKASKPVIASINKFLPSQVSFISVLSFEEANGSSLNELALQMANGNIYSMATFEGFTKTQQMEITFTWKIQML